MNKEDLNLTPEQREVMNVYDKNVIVSASAGSGKTFIMIKKIADYITQKNIHINELLVLTYTKAAASEMKQKLIKELQELAVEKPELLNEIEDASLADISTFDSFCQKLAKRYFYILNIDPAFNIIQGSEQTEIQKRALKKAIKNYKKANEEKYFMLFDSFASNRTEKNIYELVLSLFSYECSILDYNNFKQQCENLFVCDGKMTTDLVFDKFKNEILDCKEICQRLITHCINYEYKNYLDAYNERMSFLESLNLTKNLSQLLDIFNTQQEFTAIPRTKVDDWFKNEKAVFSKRFDDVKALLSKFGTSDDLKNSISYCKEVTYALIELCEQFKNEYDKIKASKNAYDYNDIERFTLKLFEDEKILSQIKNSYKQIFVDEFQDANLIQEKILNCLSRGNNLFFVGDLKQAIYGFRQSNSKIFERLTKEFDKDQNSKSLGLNCNFRTTEKVLDFINKVFNVVMTEKIASVDYTKVNLQPKAQYDKEKDTTVELNILYGNEEKTPAQDFVYDLKEDINDKLDSHILEANYISKKITDLLGQKIYDVNLKTYRNVEYKDICILFRTRTHQDVFVSELNSCGIPTLENSNKDLEGTYDIQVLINLLKVSQNFKEDISLSSVMMSDLFCFDVDEMLNIKTNEYKCFYDCVLNYNEDDKIKEKIQKMQEIIKKFNKIATFDGINKAFKFVLNETNYLFKICNNVNCVSRRKNVFDFIESFNNSKYNHNIYEYLNFLDTSTREQKVVSKLSSDNVVTLTTMHSSKGLEWPIIIIPDLSADFTRGNPGSTESKLVINNDIGIGIKYYDTKENSRQSFESIFYYLVNSKNKDDEFSESLRLLYVALTRAKNRLILIGSVKDTNNFSHFKNDYDVRKSNNYLSLIVNSLNEGDINKINAKMENFNLYNDEAFVCNVIKKEDCVKFEEENKALVIDNKVEESKLNEFVEYMQKPYFNQEAVHIAQKNSVSSILKQQDDFISINCAPQKLTLNEHLSEDIKKNEIGSAYHKVFELFDFNKVANWQSVKDIITKIEKQGVFTKETTKLLNINLIINNINIIKELVGDGSVIKEHTFVMQLPYCEIENSQVKDNVLVQGICDLIILKKDETILVDYKYSSLDCEHLLNRYKKQLFLYTKAVEYGLNKGNVQSYLLSIKDAKLIKNK